MKSKGTDGTKPHKQKPRQVELEVFSEKLLLLDTWQMKHPNMAKLLLQEGAMQEGGMTKHHWLEEPILQ